MNLPYSSSSIVYLPDMRFTNLPYYSCCCCCYCYHNHHHPSTPLLYAIIGGYKIKGASATILKLRITWSYYPTRNYGYSLSDEVTVYGLKSGMFTDFILLLLITTLFCFKIWCWTMPTLFCLQRVVLSSDSLVYYYPTSYTIFYFYFLFPVIFYYIITSLTHLLVFLFCSLLFFFM